MAAVRGLVKSAIVLKVFDIVRREAAKPENQAKARELAQRVAQEVQKRRGSRSPGSSSGAPGSSTRTPS
jgi:hypothetical protein